MNVIGLIIVASIFIFLLYSMPFFKACTISFRGLIALFGLKCMAACALHYIYTRYYPTRVDADIFKYFDDALVMYSASKHSITDFLKLFFSIDSSNPDLGAYYEAMNFWIRKIDYGLFNDNRTVIRINALLMFVSQGNIFIHHLAAAFMSLYTGVLIYKVFLFYFPRRSRSLIIGIFLIPSLVFWSSAMLKETIALLGIALLLYGVLFFYRLRLWKSLLYIFLGFIVLSTIKIYVLAALLPVILAFFISRQWRYISPWKIYVSIYALAIITVVLSHIVGIIPIIETVVNKRNDFISDILYYGLAESYIPIGKLEPTLMAVVKETPIALWRAISLPLPWDVRKLIEVIPAIENIVLLILIFLATVGLKKSSKKQTNIILFSLFFSLGIVWFIGLTTPVVGAIVRYKVPMMPFLYTSLLLIIDWKALQKWCHTVWAWSKT